MGLAPWYLFLFLGSMGTIQAPGTFETKDSCIEHGKEIVETYKTYHKHSPGFFWCLPGGDK